MTLRIFACIFVYAAISSGQAFRLYKKATIAGARGDA